MAQIVKNGPGSNVKKKHDTSYRTLSTYMNHGLLEIHTAENVYKSQADTRRHLYDKGDYRKVKKIQLGIKREEALDNEK